MVFIYIKYINRKQHKILLAGNMKSSPPPAPLFYVWYAACFGVDVHDHPRKNCIVLGGGPRKFASV